jgi:hypothetical protein
MQIIHEAWGIIIKLPSGAEVEIHKDEGSCKLEHVTLNGIPAGAHVVSRDIDFKQDGTILADGFVI